MTPSAVPARWSSAVCRWLAGADAGVGGAVLALLWLAAHSRLSGVFWWAKFNVAAAPFFGDRVFSSGFGVATLTGAASLFLGFVLLGALIGRLTPAPPFWYRSLFFGLLGSLLLYLASHRWLWPLVHPFAPAYFTPLATLPAHLLFGLMMVRIGRRYLALMVAFGGLEWPPPAPSPAALDVLPVQPEGTDARVESPEDGPVPPPEAPAPIVEQPPDPLK